MLFDKARQTYPKILWEWSVLSCSIILFVEKQLAEFETGEDVTLILKKRNLLEDHKFKEVFKKSLQIIGRDDLARNFEIYFAAGK